MSSNKFRVLLKRIREKTTFYFTELFLFACWNTQLFLDICRLIKLTLSALSCFDYHFLVIFVFWGILMILIINLRKPSLGNDFWRFKV